MKRISMIIPVYNAEPYIRAMVESLQAQDWENLQILLSDDGSTDGSVDLMTALAEQDPRITVVVGPNTGVSSARNRALRLADGEYIGFADSDDILEPGYLHGLVSALEESGTDMACCGFHRHYVRSGKQDGLPTDGHDREVVDRDGTVKSRMIFKEGSKSSFLYSTPFGQATLGVDTRHNPEFTLMELYQAYTDYEGMMELTESMFRYLAEKVCGTTKITYNGIEIDLGKPFGRMTMNDAIKKYAGVDFDTVTDDEAAKKLADERHIEYEDRHTKGDIINLFFEEYCEKELIQPTFITDHPVAISPLTKKKPSDPDKVERFELFINTWEMCNAYSELNDPIDQRERFAAQDAAFEAGDEEANHTDEDFLNALEIGMPPTGGIGYGIDRLVMLLTDSAAIRDVLLFPTMKSLDK